MDTSIGVFAAHDLVGDVAAVCAEQSGVRVVPFPYDHETSAPGLFVAGDARHGSTKRVGGAVGEGAMAAALVHRRLDELSGLQP